MAYSMSPVWDAIKTNKFQIEKLQEAVAKLEVRIAYLERGTVKLPPPELTEER